jgi:hypothetical protein
MISLTIFHCAMLMETLALLISSNRSQPTNPRYPSKLRKRDKLVFEKMKSKKAFPLSPERIWSNSLPLLSPASPLASLFHQKIAKARQNKDKHISFQNKDSKTRTQQKSFFHHFRSPKRNLLRTFNTIEARITEKRIKIDCERWFISIECHPMIDALHRSSYLFLSAFGVCCTFRKALWNVWKMLQHFLEMPVCILHKIIVWHFQNENHIQKLNYSYIQKPREPRATHRRTALIRAYGSITIPVFNIDGSVTFFH